MKPTEAAIHIISLGAGVQSSTMALMAKHGEIQPMPTAAIFADTGDETAAVYKWLHWIEGQLPFRVVRVSIGVLSLAALALHPGKKRPFYLKPGLPVFFKDGGMATRQCTEDFKIVPIHRCANQLRGGRSVVQWLGISTDEASRMKTSRVAWMTNDYPLIKAGISRQQCYTWMDSHGYPRPPRSACVYCPYHSDAEWQRLKSEEPTEFARAVQFELDYQVAAAECFDKVPYLHRSCLPLSEVNFDINDKQFNLFINECEGMCGV